MTISIPERISARLGAEVSRGVKAVTLSDGGHLIFTLTDNSTADLGALSVITDHSVKYREGVSGTEIPNGAWGDDIPAVAQGNYLWTRTQTGYADGETVTVYNVSRMGLDGSGSVVTVNGKSPDSSGNVTMDNEDVGAAAAEHGHTVSDISDFPSTMTPAAHSHGMNDVTGLSTALEGKAGASHDHGMSQVTGLSTALEGKAAASHDHAIGQVTGLSTALGGKAEIVKLWENASPESTFPAQNINCPLDDGDLVLITYKSYRTSANYISQLIPYPMSGNLPITGPFNCTRFFLLTGQQIHFESANLYPTYASATVNTDNDRCVPYSIYRVRGVQA